MKSTHPNIKKFITIFYALFLTSQLFSQETVLYFGANGKITDPDHATEMLNIQKKSPIKTTIQTFLQKEKTWEKATTDLYRLENDSTIQIRENSADFTGTIYRTFHRPDNNLYVFSDVIKKQVVRRGTAKSLVPLVLQGEVTEFYKNGNIKSVSQYRNNELVSNQNWNADGTPYIDHIFYSVDVYPTFRPGARVINQKLMEAFRNSGIDISSISGSLVIGFVVMEDGQIDGVKVLKGLGPTINTAAVETIKNLKGEWTPAKLDDQVVRFFQVFPINFIYKTQSFEFAELRGSTLHWGAY
jgi:hypothetical protein